MIYTQRLNKQNFPSKLEQKKEYYLMRKSQGTTSNGIFFTNQRYVDASQMIRQTEQAKYIEAVEKSSRWLWIKSVACTTHGVAHHWTQAGY